MEQERINEAKKCIPLLEQCRKHLDNARFKIGDDLCDERLYYHYSEVYNLICEAIDKL